uniref:Methyltransferase FkbM domain-containing protein n=1 Tax=viral metagenome TaxID=1070528 RepID=A0A6C0KTM1_9ZZZZ
MLITVLYGKEKYVDVTEVVFKTAKSNKFYVPAKDIERFYIFQTDPLHGIVKNVLIIKDGQTEVLHEGFDKFIDLTNCTWSEERLSFLHKHLQFENGSIYDELPEQRMAIKFINPYSTVLELGSNIGRNSLIIASILASSKNFVTLECDPNTVLQLLRNRDLNDLHFFMEPAALSKKALIQRGWETKPFVENEEGWRLVNVINFLELETKYNMKFDTIVADCEGALYDIFKDEPNMLSNIKTIIMENDYWDINKKLFVDDYLLKRGFYRVYKEQGGWGPCAENFYEVWKKFDVVKISLSFGFFYNCSERLLAIIKYFNTFKQLPDCVDSSEQYTWYKTDQTKDITFDYFLDYQDTDVQISYNKEVRFQVEFQFENYKGIDYTSLKPFLQKYFTPSEQVKNNIKNIELKYNLENDYDNICVLFYRGNDKATETSLSSYDSYTAHADEIMKSQPNIKFLLQSDEKEFIDFMTAKYNNTFYFKDEIRIMNKQNSTVDKVFAGSNNKFSKLYLAITVIMAKCKYVICGSGNCSLWIMFYRQNAENVTQYLNGVWYK